MIYKATYDADYLEHHGILGQKWGVRRYQNEDGTLTELGKKHQEQMTASNKEATIAKGTKLYRVSNKAETDAGNYKLYLSGNKESGEFYDMELGSSKIYNSGKAFVQQYVANTDIIMPDKKTMEKIELGLLKDKDVQKELVNSLMSKGMSREAATDYVKPYSAGREFINDLEVVGAFAAMSGANFSLLGIGYGPGAVALAGGIGAAAGAVTAVPLVIPNEDKKRALNAVRVSYGDHENKVTNQKLRDALASQGYNAMKDYNDRRAYGKKAGQAIMVMDSDKNVSLRKSWELSKTEYGKEYARNYLREHPNSKLSFSDLTKDGENRYQKYYNQGLIARETKKRNAEILANAGVSKADAQTTTEEEKKKKTYS